MNQHVVIMGVAGCGKSSLGAAVAQSRQLALIEGDAHHSALNLEKMRQGNALSDADRSGWLRALCEQLRAHSRGAVLTCSALKRAYRDRLREACPGLRFVFLDIDRDHALARVEARTPRHFFSASLVDSQFATLEPPLDEPAVLRLDARLPLAQLQHDVAAWLNDLEHA